MLFAAFLVSCDLLLDLIDLEGDLFYAQDFRTNMPYTLRAKKLAEGEKCVIWAENGSGVDEKKAKEIAAKYDKDIRKKIVDAFGMKNITADGKNFDDILDYANWLAGKENKKLTILLLDIKDDFNGTSKLSFVAGYFASGNFYKKNQVSTSNECDMIYVDTYPSLSSKYPQLEQRTYSTFAHELQHLINFTTTLLVERKNSSGKVSPMDTWIDEGLSSQAEQIYSGENIKDHCTQFNKSETIAKGNNFFVWGEKPAAILDEYATVYLFFRWLSLQAEAKGIQNLFLNIVTSKDSDYRIITNVAKNINSNWTDWDTVLRSWFAANYYPNNTDYGYKDSFFYTGDTKITIKPLTSITSTPLFPGEGVYSRIIGSYKTPSPSGNIRYAELNKITEKALLTFNASTNSDKNAKQETGTLTGAAASVSSSDSGTADSQSRMVIEDEQAHTGPYRIDARDYAGIFGRNK